MSVVLYSPSTFAQGSLGFNLSLCPWFLVPALPPPALEQGPRPPVSLHLGSSGHLVTTTVVYWPVRSLEDTNLGRWSISR